MTTERSHNLKAAQVTSDKPSDETMKLNTNRTEKSMTAMKNKVIKRMNPPKHPRECFECFDAKLTIVMWFIQSDILCIYSGYITCVCV